MSATRKFTAKSFAKYIRDSTKDGQELIDLAISIMRGKVMGPGTKAINTDWNQKMAAASWLADRGWGKAAQVIELEVQPSEATPELQEYTIAELEAMLVVMRTAEEPSSIGSSP